jgi:hypothetical protein
MAQKPASLLMISVQFEAAAVPFAFLGMHFDEE